MEKQARIDSVMETVTSTTIGLVVSTIANATLTPWVLGHTITAGENVVLSIGFTVISVARGYLIRRLFNGKTPWVFLKAKFGSQPAQPKDYAALAKAAHARATEVLEG